MDGNIESLITDQSPGAVARKLAIFGPNFQHREQWNRFLTMGLCCSPTNPSLFFSKDVVPNSPQAFQALYIACWIHRPVMKGTMMIDLGGVKESTRQSIKFAHVSLPKRWSTHLGGEGRSAGENFNFILGGNELLVQYEETGPGRRPFLMLKMEGHRTDSSASLAEKIRHIGSYFHKAKKSEGKSFNAALTAFFHGGGHEYTAAHGPRSAENFSKGWKKVMKKAGYTPGNLVTGRLGKHAEAFDSDFRRITVVETLAKLASKTQHPMLKGIDFQNATNGHIADRINWFVEHLKRNERGFFKDQYQDRNDDHPLYALELVAKKFEEDGPNEFNYLENRISPSELDISLARFFNTTSSH